MDSESGHSQRPRGFIFEASVLDVCALRNGDDLLGKDAAVDSRDGAPGEGPEKRQDEVLDGWSGVQTRPGVGSLLRRLRQKGYRVGIMRTEKGGDMEGELQGVLGGMGLERREVVLVLVAAMTTGGDDEERRRVVYGMRVVWVEAEEKNGSDMEGRRVSLRESDGGPGPDGNWPPLGEGHKNGTFRDIRDTEDLDGNWSPLNDGHNNGTSRDVRDTEDPDGNWSPLKERNGEPGPDGNFSPLDGHHNNGTFRDIRDTEDLDGNWSPLNDGHNNGTSRDVRDTEDPDGNWSPLKEDNGEPGPDGNFSPLKDPPSQKTPQTGYGHENDQPAPYNNKNKVHPNGNFSPLNDSPTHINGISRLVATPPDGNWSPLKATHQHPGPDGNYSPLKEQDHHTNKTSQPISSDDYPPPNEPRLSRGPRGNWSPLHAPAAATLDDALAEFL
ncbi:hypothetical protein E4U55_005952 [Claviceps digitariae]|nr:hypothetical protein E4U55_005952 [Claviceps digitariae]